jgi:hypothetical protein
MKTFGTYIQEQKNLHMTHIQDSALYGGTAGLRSAINSMRAMRDMLSGSSTKSVDVTVKWDGAPAVFCGIDPTDGKFFVAKKGIFNKTPKVYKTDKEIDEDIDSPDLNEKMKIALSELSKLNIKGVVQGDIMFTQSDLKTDNIDGESYITFHPNTIVYAVPSASDEAKAIKKAKIGVVFHTAYSGNSFESMSASYGVDVDKFRKVPSVWAQSATLPDISGSLLMTKAETDEVTKHLAKVGSMFRTIPSAFLEAISDGIQGQTIETFNNSLIRSRSSTSNGKQRAAMFLKWLEERAAKDAAKLKTDKGREAAMTKAQLANKFYHDNVGSLVALYELQDAFIQAKLLLINKLNQMNKIGTFVKTKNGFRIAKPEGYVAIDRLSGGALKMVDQLEFSANNFDPDLIKGWQK